MKREKRNRLYLVLLCILSILPTVASAETGNQYCVTPPFITAGVKPNLLLMIDNSASMYDLVYQDTGNRYCANSPTTACTVDSTCPASASCKASQTSTSSTVYSAIVCTADSQCPNSVITYTAKACTSNAQCTANGSKCSGGVCSKCNTITGVGDCSSVPKCNNGRCTKCDTTTGTGDCTSVTTTTYSPIACTTDETCAAITTGDTCNNKCSLTRQCYDTTYDNNKYCSVATTTSCTTDSDCPLITGSTTTHESCAAKYFGYFDRDTIYGYDFTNDKFVGGATMPASCTYSAGATKYFCINTTGTGADESIVTDATGFVASGNFLNWLSASKFDVEKQILTGGKFDPASSVLVAESRGCAGRKFIKSIPGVNLSFAIHGGTPGGLSTTQSQATEYGQTYIEIFTGIYNASDCLAAMNDWMTIYTSPTNLGSFQTDTKGCVGAGNSEYNATNIWNHILHDCYNGILGKAQGYSTNLGPLQGECSSAYASLAASGVTNPPASITDPNSGISICSSALSYTDASGTAQTGYLGACYNTATGTWNDACALTQMQNFCTLNVNTTPVADPSSTDMTGSGSSAPGFILEQGLMNTRKIYTFTTKVAQATTPSGLVEKYSDRIRFGAMTFQNDGAGSECGVSGSFACAKACYSASTGYTTRLCYLNSDCPSGQSCQALPKADGGKIIAYVGAGACSVSTTVPCFVDADCSSLTPSGQYCNPSIGDHSPGHCSSTTTTPCTVDANCPGSEYCRVGLLRAIDDIPATSWTPFAEGFYNAMGYFARSNAYTVSVPTSRSDANFSTLPTANTATSYVTDRNPSQFRCQSNNIMLITDGMSTADKNSASDALAAMYASSVPNIISGTTTYGLSGYDTTNKCPVYSGSRSVSALAWIAKNRDIKSLATSGTVSTGTPQAASESITTYVVYSGPQASSQPGLCDPKTLMANTAKNGGTELFAATNPAELNRKIEAALSDIAAKAASGTAASILSNSEGSGANILQAVFYPKKIFDNSTYVNWIGEMQNLWYFVDPYIQNSTIREDTVRDLKLILNEDYIVRFAFDNSSDKTMVQRYNDANGDSVVADSDKVGGLIDPDYVSSIWRAGLKLWKRSDSGSEVRTIYTGYGSTADSTPQLFTNTILNPSPTYVPGFWDDLQIPAGTDAQRYGITTKLINFIRGTDQADDSPPCLNTECKYRNRKVTMGFCSNASTKRCTPATVSTDCPTGASCIQSTHEWKLGDIISSTPRVQSTVRLNTYNLPPSGGYNDKSYQSFINSNNYRDHGMVYVGANDGMFHAFSLGILDVTAQGFKKATLTEPSGTVIGEEKWAFIPKHSLPYLKYFSDKDYDHIYYIDGRTTLIDASIGDTNDGSCVRATYWECDKPRNGTVAIVDSSNNLTTANTWRTVVIAGMGLGGASVDPSVTACTEGATGNCVKTPRPGLGYSSYFALDVTDPENPKFLWEFSNSNLGFATTAPAIVRIGDKDKNGRWFAVFGNGPLGPIDPGSHQFKGESVDHLRFFVVDLRTGDRVATLNDTDTLGLSNAYVGTLLGGAIDADRRDITASGNYQDDAVYAGYVQKTTGTGWTDGGVLRIMTKEDPNPANWVVSKVISGIGPVTTSIARTVDTKNRNLWLYFGTGRFYFRDAVGLDDNDTRRSLFGLQEPCYNTTTRPGNFLDPNCTTELSTSSLKDQTSSVGTMTSTDKGWQILLDAANSSTHEGAERVVTDTVALTNGTVFFTSFKPTMDICGYGGNSFLWGVKYDTGGQALANALVGKALIQLSTGEFKEVDLSTAFTDKQGRRMESPMTGKPPSDAPPIVSSSSNRPVKKILHIQEH